MKQAGSDGTEQGYFQQRIAWSCSFPSCLLIQSLWSHRLDIMGATTSSRMPYLTSEELKVALNKFMSPTGREWGFDVFYCPIDLFEYIADITVLYKRQNPQGNPSDEVLNQAIILGNAVMTWKLPNGTSKPRTEMIEVWRQGILLYLVRLFRLSDEVFNTSGLLNGIFRQAEHIPPKTSWRFSMTWPLFQAGLSLRHEAGERKHWLRSELTTKFKILGCFHAKRAIGTLEHVWRTGDNHQHSFLTLLL